MIWNNCDLPEIRLVKMDNKFDSTMASTLERVENDVVNNIDNEEYELSNLNAILVDVDITKENIRQIDQYKFDIK